MRKRANDIQEKGYKIIVIAPSKASFIQPFLEHFGPYPFEIYGDPNRDAYKEMGHVTMPKIKLLLKAGFGFITGKVKNFFPEDINQKEFVKQSMKTQDVYIQGGTWLFSSDGELVWKHIDSSPEDHATIDDVLKQMN